MTPLFELAPMGVLAHMIGDYSLQSDWMATQKMTNKWAALAHVLVYAIPFAILCTHNPIALFIIVSTHFVIDHWRLARYVCWLKNFLAPKRKLEIGSHLEDGVSGIVTDYVVARNLPWEKCSGTGYPEDRPPWLSVWLLIITDNTMHILINALALTYFP
jgi:hypothetical protein